jgi:aryl-alcohol dehydrogenase-like predicted oxidoreductase
MTGSKIVLGTVQFGLPYGVSNTRGQVSHDEGRAILARAREAGIDTLDTAIAYGESEAALGTIGVADWQIITKLPEVPDNCVSVADWVEAHVDGSLARLGTSALHGLLLHRPEQLHGSNGLLLYTALVDQRKRGRISKIGISIYGPAELDDLPAAMRFDIVQAPFNVLDTRMIRSGWAARLRDTGTEFHARSIFLQGLLLMPAGRRPVFFSRWEELLADWDSWLEENCLTALEACMRHALHTPEISRLVIGVDSMSQLTEIAAAAANDGRLPSLPAELATVDAALINPSLWNQS